jgi:Leucine-rich repeat (LRR) protein
MVIFYIHTTFGYIVKFVGLKEFIVKRLYPLLFISVLIYWGCEEEIEEDTTPPTVSITSPQDGSTVSDSITITCISSDDEGVEKVELWVNGVSTGVTDDTEPYSLEWNTLTYDNGSYGITVRSYDTSGNTTDSEPIILVVNKTVELWGEYYSIENTTELHLGGEGLTGEIPPEIGNLVNLTVLYLYGNELTGNIPSEMGNLINLETLYLHTNQLTGEIPPEIGNLTNLKLLYSFNNQLTGGIPTEMGDLINLEWLFLENNQLNGEIPESICNLVENNCNIFLSNNQLCPPYPSCIENIFLEEQDCD